MARSPAMNTSDFTIFSTSVPSAAAARGGGVRALGKRRDRHVAHAFGRQGARASARATTRVACSRAMHASESKLRGCPAWRSSSSRLEPRHFCKRAPGASTVSAAGCGRAADWSACTRPTFQTLRQLICGRTCRPPPRRPAPADAPLGLACGGAPRRRDARLRRAPHPSRSRSDRRLRRRDAALARGVGALAVAARRAPPTRARRGLARRPAQRGHAHPGTLAGSAARRDWCRWAATTGWRSGQPARHRPGAVGNFARSVLDQTADVYGQASASTSRSSNCRSTTSGPWTWTGRFARRASTASSPNAAHASAHSSHARPGHRTGRANESGWSRH